MSLKKEKKKKKMMMRRRSRKKPAQFPIQLRFGKNVDST
jgi:hypothetical protein